MPWSDLVDAATLAKNLDDPGLKIVDCRHLLAEPAAGERAYRHAHLPGALFLHLDRDLSGGALCGGRHPLPDPDRLRARLGALGIGAETQVVAYDDAGGMIAGRLWWLMRWLGHRAVAVLDGGLQAWERAGLPMSAAIPEPTRADFPDRPALARWVSVGEVLSALETRSAHVVDARSPDRFRGENETLDPVGGHIPGAINRFFRDNLEATGCFKSPEQLRREWTDRIGGVSPAAIIHQCGSGVSACHNILAMERAGLGGSRLYAGSWSEWCADPARPVAVGEK